MPAISRDAAMIVKGTPAYYGNLSRVAMEFAVSTGNPAEFDAAEVYARAAVRTAVVFGLVPNHYPPTGRTSFPFPPTQTPTR